MLWFKMLRYFARNCQSETARVDAITVGQIYLVKG